LPFTYSSPTKNKMKQIKNLVLGLGLLIVICTKASAQQAPIQNKIAYSNLEYIVSKLPETATIGQILEKQRAEYTTLLEEKAKSFKEKLDEFQSKGASLPEIIQKDKQKELETLQASIQELQTNAQKDIEQKQNQLLQPLYIKAYKGIQDFAEKNGYQFIFNTGSESSRSILVAPASDDVSEAILKSIADTKPDPATTAALIEELKRQTEVKPAPVATKTAKVETAAKNTAKPVQAKPATKPAAKPTSKPATKKK
jgi:outer membrane protein